MAVSVFRNAFFAVNGNDFSCDVTELTLNYSSEMLDATTICDNTRIHVGGLKDWSIEATFNQEFGTNSVDSVLFAILGTTSCVEIRPTNACSSAVNPIYTGIAVLDTYTPLAGSVGTILQTQGSFQSASALSRASSS